jgi:hypothetical protein
LSASADLRSVPPADKQLSITFDDEDYHNMRYVHERKEGEIKIGARHPSTRRYLGRKEDGCPGQNEKHFRLVLAEIVINAVCSDTLSRNIEMNYQDYREADRDRFYYHISTYLTELLPIAHRIVLTGPRGTGYLSSTSDLVSTKSPASSR